MEDLRQVGGGEAREHGPRAVIGPGTGLGVAGLVRDDRGGWVAIDGEGGHATLTATTAREWRVVEWLARRYGHASAERAMSGPGLVDIHAALCAIDGKSAPAGGGAGDAGPSEDAATLGAAAIDGAAIDAATITSRALQGDDRGQSKRSISSARSSALSRATLP